LQAATNGVLSAGDTREIGHTQSFRVAKEDQRTLDLARSRLSPGATFAESVLVSRLLSMEQQSMTSISFTSLTAHPKASRSARAACALLVSVAGLCAFSGTAGAQTATGVMKHDTATAGKSDVATETFATVAKPDDKAKDTTEAKIVAGGLWATGNSRSLATTALGTVRTRRGPNEFSAALAANYGRAAAKPEEDMTTTVENYQGKLRYDRFVSERVSLFLSLSGRRDRFQGLDVRMNLDPGLAYYFFTEEKQRFWGELGYDYQYDVRRDDAIAAARANDGIVLGKTKSRHSARAFLGYHTNVNEHVSFDSGAEFLLGIPKTENWRLNWDNSLTVALDERFSLGATFNLRYDHNPLPAVETLDTITAMNLICTLY
jgi:putative salt-induced outer membrane protein